MPREHDRTAGRKGPPRREEEAMKPSVHLKEVATGKRRVVCCTCGPDLDNHSRLGSGDFWMGRTPGSEIRLDHRSVSRMHAVLRVVDGTLRVRDRGSRHGTFGNETRIGGWQEVRPGDSVRLSAVELKVLWAGEGLSPVRPEHLAWNGGTVVKVAAATKEQRSFTDLPVLADALEEAGCTDPAALAYLRRAEGSGPAVYLLELIVGRDFPLRRASSTAGRWRSIPSHCPRRARFPRMSVLDEPSISDRKALSSHWAALSHGPPPRASPWRLVAWALKVCAGHGEISPSLRGMLGPVR
jgi:hypothetical protein